MGLFKRLFRTSTDNTLIQLFRYTFVGGTAFLADFFTLYMLTEYAGVHYLVSAGIAFILGSIVNYLLSVIWVFNVRRFRSRTIEIIFFVSIGAIGLGLNELFIWFFTEIVMFFYLISKLISTAIVYFWNFFARKYFLYTRSEEK